MVGREWAVRNERVREATGCAARSRRHGGGVSAGFGEREAALEPRNESLKKALNEAARRKRLHNNTAARNARGAETAPRSQA
jgi:hypothetical protein